MKYGILWRTKGLAKLLVNKVELNLTKVVFTTSLWFAKEPYLVWLGRRMIILIDQAKAHTNYGIKKLTDKSEVTDWLLCYNIVDHRLATEMNRVTLAIKEYNSNKEGA